MIRAHGSIDADGTTKFRHHQHCGAPPDIPKRMLQGHQPAIQLGERRIEPRRLLCMRVPAPQFKSRNTWARRYCH